MSISIMVLFLTLKSNSSRPPSSTGLQRVSYPTMYFCPFQIKSLIIPCSVSLTLLDIFWIVIRYCKVSTTIIQMMYFLLRSEECVNILSIMGPQTAVLSILFLTKSSLILTGFLSSVSSTLSGIRSDLLFSRVFLKGFFCTLPSKLVSLPSCLH